VSPISVDLTGKVALVTGASGGFGRHFSLALAKNGAKVALAARRVEVLSALADEIRAAGGQAVPVKFDVTSPESIRAGVAQVAAELGGIDILVNNSGLATNKPFFEQSEKDWDQIIDTNLKGAFLISQEVGKHMRDTQRGGSIINVASVLGLRQTTMVTPYAVSKAGLIQLTKQMALELARFNIRVNAIAPGYFETDINRDFFATEAGASMIKRIPQRRLGNFDDLLGPLLLLASDASRYMTAATLVVDGGHLVSSL
jgi:NAD(P)-dependent dehydrogenase (short-subunit alcohol dehydrogenase family)